MSYTKLNRGPEEPIHPDVILALDLLKVGDSGDFNKASLKVRINFYSDLNYIIDLFCLFNDN